VVIEDLIPYIDANFRTIADQPHRAMAGSSMGGMQTRSIAPAHLDTFSHIGVFSGGSIAVTNITDMAKFKEQVKLVFISYGSRELGTNRVAGAASAAIPRRTPPRSNRRASPGAPPRELERPTHLIL
jgi:predicted alpha/beta superfamily hydrolase